MVRILCGLIPIVGYCFECWHNKKMESIRSYYHFYLRMQGAFRSLAYDYRSDCRSIENDAETTQDFLYLDTKLKEAMGDYCENFMSKLGDDYQAMQECDIPGDIIKEYKHDIYELYSSYSHSISIICKKNIEISNKEAELRRKNAETAELIGLYIKEVSEDGQAKD